MLHSFDGLDVLEEGDDYRGELGLHDPEDFDPHFDAGALPLVVPGSSDKVEEENEFFVLQAALITHFAQRRKRGSVRWLKS